MDSRVNVKHGGNLVAWGETCDALSRPVGQLNWK